MKIMLFVRVLAALFGFLVLNTALAFLPMQGWNWLPNILVAFVMAGLILLFFMKVRSSEPLVAVTSGAGLTWLSLLVLLVILDYVSRPWP
jgi:caa(3)-type oxidase subunit IV